MSRTHRLAALGTASLLAGAGLVGLGTVPALADDVIHVTVLSGDDAITGSLGWAVDQANADPDADEIVFDVTGTMYLTGNLPRITQPLTITGPGRDLLMIAGGGHGTLRVDNEPEAVPGLAVTITGLTVSGSSGDGVRVENATLTLDDVLSEWSEDGIQVNNTAAYGVTITNSEFSNNDDRAAELTLAGSDSSIADSVFADSARELYASLSGDAALELSGVSLSGMGGNNLYARLVGGASLTSTGLVSTQAGSRGVDLDLEDSATAGLTGTAITDSAGQGFHADLSDDAQLTIDGLEQSGAGESGLVVNPADGSVATVANAVVQQNVDDGVSIDELEGEASFTRVQTLDNGVYGFDVGYVDDGELTIAESTSDGNLSGIYLGNADGEAVITLDSSTFSRNIEGGAWLWANQATITVVNSTVTGTNASGEASDYPFWIGGYGEGGVVTFSVLHTTITDNVGQVGAGFGRVEGTISHSIIAGNDYEAGGADLVLEPADVVVEWSLIGTVSDLGAVSGLETAALVEGEGAEFGVTDPGLEPLADNGGPTRTHLLLSTSPALDGGDPGISGEPETDQRGEARVSGSAIDIGAVEVEQALPATGAETGAALGGGILLLLLGAALTGARGLRRRTA